MENTIKILDTNCARVTAPYFILVDKTARKDRIDRYYILHAMGATPLCTAKVRVEYSHPFIYVIVTYNITQAHYLSDVKARKALCFSPYKNSLQYINNYVATEIMNTFTRMESDIFRALASRKNITSEMLHAMCGSNGL